MSGDGWAEGGDGTRISLSTGQGAYFERSEFHSKGSDTGMTVLMVQVSDFELRVLEVPVFVCLTP